MRVFITRPLPFHPSLPDVEIDIWDSDTPPDRETLLKRVKGCSGLLTMLTEKVDAELLDAAGGSLKIVSNCAAGYDNIDIKECSTRSIAVGHTPGVLTSATADLTWALLLAIARGVREGAQRVQSGDWSTWNLMEFLGSDVTGSTLGIIGFGAIGRAVAERARGFGMRVLVATRSVPHVPAGSVNIVDQETLLAMSDFVSLHVPLTADTQGMVNTKVLNHMKGSAFLINTSRGKVVDQSDLLEALRSGTIAGAALDVTYPEPLPPEHPLVYQPNCLITPHMGSATVKTRRGMARMAVENLKSGLLGTPLRHQVPVG